MCVMTVHVIPEMVTCLQAVAVAMPEEAVEELAGAIQDANGGPIKIVSNGPDDKQRRGSGAGMWKSCMSPSASPAHGCVLGKAPLIALVAFVVSDVSVCKAVHCSIHPNRWTRLANKSPARSVPATTAGQQACWALELLHPHLQMILAAAPGSLCLH